MSHFKKISTAAVIILIAVFVYRASDKNGSVVDLPIQDPIFETPIPDQVEEKNSDVASPEASNAQTEKNLPSQYLLNVSFLAQAPFAIWDPLHEDACEEASLVMLKHFLDKDESISPMAGDVEIRKLIRYEEQNGYGLSITMEQLARIAKDFYKMEKPRVEKNITVQDIKKELAAGRPVIVPAAGKILPNPNFRNGGPNYHMLVVVGYDQAGFITNDPGTRKGEGFRYTFEDLYYAIHDWDEANILNGQKAYLVFDDPA